MITRTVPADHGSEHKSFKEKRSEYIETEIDKMVKTINEKYDKTFMNRIEQVVMMEMALYGGTHDEYLTKIYESFCDVLHGEMRNKMFDCAKSDPIKALEADADNAEVRQRINDWLKRKELEIKNAPISHTKKSEPQGPLFFVFEKINHQSP